MKPLRVALIYRGYNPLAPEERLCGFWSYPVPEFEVTHIHVDKGFILSREDLAKEHDIIVYEDTKLFGKFTGNARIPIFYGVVDSTLGEGYYQARLKECKQVDVILVEQDDLERFEHLGKPTWRFTACLNDKVFHDYGLEKTVDVSFYNKSFHKDAPGAWERVTMRKQLAEFCAGKGLTYACEHQEWIEYAKNFNRSKMTVNLCRKRGTRPYRTMDALGAKTCLLTDWIPIWEGDGRQAGMHYLVYENITDLKEIILKLLASGGWKDVSEAGYELVQAKHTWAQRAHELRERIGEELHL